MDQNNPNQPIEPYRSQVGQPVEPQWPGDTAPQGPPVQVNVTKKKRNTLLIAGIAGLILLVGLAAGGYFLYNNFLNRPAVTVARLLPANTLGYLTIDPSPEGSQKAAFDNMRAAFEAQPGFKEAWDNITKSTAEQSSSLLGGQDCEYGGNIEDTSSYLGNNVTLAVLPPSTGDLEKLEGASSDPSIVQDVMSRNIVGIVDLDFNPLNKKGPIADLKRQTGDPSKMEVAEKYKDVEIRKFSACKATVYFSLLDGTSTAVIGAKVEPVRAIIDQFKDEKGALRNDATFKTLSGQVPQDRIAALYINVTEIYKQVRLAAPDVVNQTTADGAFLMTLSGQNDGVQIDIASEADIQGLGGVGSMSAGTVASGMQVNPDAKPDASTISDIPTDSIGFLVGADLKTPIQATLDAVRKQDAQSVSSIENNFKEQTGLDLRRDILPLLGGDYVLSVASQNLEESPVPPIVFQLKLNADDRAKAQEVMSKLVTSMMQGQKPQSFELEGGTFYSPMGESGPLLAGVGKDRFMVVYDKDFDSAKARVESVTNNFGKGFSNTDAWKNVSEHLPRDSNLIGYFDLTGIREMVEPTLPPDQKEVYEEQGSPFLRPFKHLLFGSATQAARDKSRSRNHTVIFLGISK